MDKRFITLALVALVGVASAANVTQKEEQKSPHVVYQDDANEVAVLLENDEMSPELKELFGEYCLSSRDLVKSYKDAKGNNAIDELFDLFPVDVLEDILKHGVLVDSGDFCKMVKANFKSKWEAVADVIRTITRATWQGDFWYLSRNGALYDFTKKTDKIIEAMRKNNGLARARDTCELIREKLVPELKQHYSSFKEKLLQESKPKNVEQTIKSTIFSNVGCALTNDLETLSRSCQYLLEAPVEDFAKIGLE